MPDQQVTTLPDGGLEISQVPAPAPQVLQLIQTPAGNVSRFIGLQHGQIVKKLEIPGATAFEISAPLPVPLKQPKIPKFSPWGRAPIIKTKPYERRSQGVQFKDLDGPYALSNIDKKREEGEGIPIFGDNPNKMPVKVNINPRSLKTTMANPKHQRKPKRLPLREVFNEEDTPPRHLDHNYYKASDNPPAGEEDPPAGVKYVEYRPNSLYPLTTKSNPTLGSIQSNVDPWRPNKPKPEGKPTQVSMDKGNYNPSKPNGAGTVVINGHPAITPLKLQTGGSLTEGWVIPGVSGNVGGMEMPFGDQKTQCHQKLLEAEGVQIAKKETPVMMDNCVSAQSTLTKDTYRPVDQQVRQLKWPREDMRTDFQLVDKRMDNSSIPYGGLAMPRTLVTGETTDAFSSNDQQPTHIETHCRQLDQVNGRRLAKIAKQQREKGMGGSGDGRMAAGLGIHCHTGNQQGMFKAGDLHTEMIIKEEFPTVEENEGVAKLPHVESSWERTQKWIWDNFGMASHNKSERDAQLVLDPETGFMVPEENLEF